MTVNSFKPVTVIYDPSGDIRKLFELEHPGYEWDDRSITDIDTALERLGPTKCNRIMSHALTHMNKLGEKRPTNALRYFFGCCWQTDKDAQRYVKKKL